MMPEFLCGTSPKSACVARGVPVWHGGACVARGVPVWHRDA